VIGLRAVRNCGTPRASKPESTSGEASVGSMFAAGSSSLSLPCSTSCIAATDVNSLTIEATRNTVSIDIFAPMSRTPNAPS
jgi:hypothetical protein